MLHWVLHSHSETKYFGTTSGVSQGVGQASLVSVLRLQSVPKFDMHNENESVRFSYELQ